MGLDTNFNVSPFYDDYDENKNFHRILFRPAVPVQARELTQLQSILQNQVERFGSNIYKQGTIIKGCSFVYNYEYQYVKILDLEVSGDAASPSTYQDLYAVDPTTNLTSVIVNYNVGLESNDPNTNILYLSYLNTGVSNTGVEKKIFSNNDVLTLYHPTYRVESVNVNDGGTGYNNSDIVVITAPASGTTASANLVTTSEGVISSIVISNKGNGYFTAPNVSVTTAGGSGANLTALNYVSQVTVGSGSLTANNTTPVGSATAVTVSDGVIYQKGHFVRVDQQTVIVDRFSNQPNNVALGFKTTESIVNNSFDTTLNDNALGFTNFNAPGAFRLKLTANLISLTQEEASANVDFFKIVEFENGKIVNRRLETEFNSIETYVSKRVSEESGDYVVQPFTVIPETITVGNSTVNSSGHLNLAVGSGLGYVDGVRVELFAAKRIPLKKATAFASKTDANITTNFGNYALVKEVLGYFDFSSGATVSLRDTAGLDVTDNFGGSLTTPGSVIGTARVRGLSYESGTLGTANCVYRMYLYDITMSNGYSFGDTRSITAAGTGVADTVLEGGKTQLYDKDFNTLIFPTGYNAVKATSMESFEYRAVSSGGSIATSGNTTVTLIAPAIFPYTVSSTLNDTQERDFIVVPLANSFGTTNVSSVTTSPLIRTCQQGNVAAGNSTTNGFFTITSHGFSNGDRIFVRTNTGNTLPTPLVNATFYFAVVATGNTTAFQLAATANGTVPGPAIYLTSNGVGAVGNSFIFAGRANTVTGNSTSQFISKFDVGDYVSFGNNTTKVVDLTTGKNIFRIASIASDTSMTVEGHGVFAANSTDGQPLAFGNTTANAALYAFPANIPLNLARGSANIQIDSTGRNAIIYVGDSINATTSVAVSYNAAKYANSTSRALTQLTTTKSVFVKLTTASIKANIRGPWSIGLPLVYKLKGIYVGSADNFSSLENTTNYATSFDLVTGDTKNKRGLYSIKPKTGSGVSLTSTSCILVEVDVFRVSAAGNFVAVDSYPVDDATNPLPNVKIRTQDIPSFTSSDAIRYNLRDVIDFRPISTATANAIATTVATATSDPSSTEVYATPVFPSPNKIFNVDIDYYLPRVDRVVIDKNNLVSVVEGTPSTTPTASPLPMRTMHLASLAVPAYPSLAPDDAQNNNTPEYGVYVKYMQTRRYTMKDIQDIEKRIERLEYYSLLSTSEIKTADLTIPTELDPTKNRFKLGFFVDNLNTTSVIDFNSLEFKVSLDTTRAVARPVVDQTLVELQYQSDTNVTVQGDLAIIDYQDTQLFNQPLASKFRNPTQFAWAFDGTMRLFPEMDIYYDTKSKNVSFTIDMTPAFEAFAQALSDSGGLDSLKNISEIIGQFSDVGPSWSGGGLNVSQTADITSTTQWTERNISVGSTKTSTEVVGEFLTSSELQPYMNARWVCFLATGLRPNTKHYMFFDSKAVDVRGATASDINALITDSSTLLTNDAFGLTGNISTFITTNAKGQAVGAFYIASQTHRIGTLDALIMDVDSIISKDTSVSKATSVFTGYAFKQETAILSMVTKAPATYNVQTINRTTVNVQEDAASRVRRWDPLAQTFEVFTGDGSDGVYLTKVDLFFKQKDPDFGMVIQIRETVAGGGFPGPKIYATKFVKSSDIVVSDNASLATTIVFDSPIYVRGGESYAIVLLPEANSPNYLVYTYDMGDRDLTNNNLIDYGDWGIGTLFLSSNDKTWTALQTEDLKIKMYAAKFTQTSGTVTLVPKPYEFLGIQAIEGQFIGAEVAAQKANTYLSNTSYTISGNTSSAVVNTSTSLTSSVQANDFLLFIYGNSNTAARTGFVNTTGNVVTGNASADFVTDYDVGDYIYINSQVREITAITNTTSMTLDVSLTSDVTNNNHYGITESYQVNKVKSVNSTAMVMKDFPEKVFSTATSNTVTIAAVGVQKVVAGTFDRIANSTFVVLRESTASSNTNRFAAGRKLVGSTSDATALITEVKNLPINYVEPMVRTITTSSTGITFNQNVMDASTGLRVNQDIRLGVSNRTPTASMIKSRSNELADNDLNRSYSLTATLQRPSDGPRTSPVVDIEPVGIVVLTNRVNNDATDENTVYGNATAKYVTKRIVLADGNEAEDIKVYLTAYKPPGTNILVYAKIRSEDDPEVFENKDWSLLSQNSVTTDKYSDLGNTLDYIEYDYTFSNTAPSSTIFGKASVVNTTYAMTFNGNTIATAGVSNVIIANTTNTGWINFGTTNESTTSALLSNGDVVRYICATANTIIGGLVNNQNYFVRTVNSSAIQLLATPGAASSVNLSSVATSNQEGHSLVVNSTFTVRGEGTTYYNANVSFNANTAINSGSDFITIFNNTGDVKNPIYANGDYVRYSTNSTATPVAGLANNSYYYVVEANTTGIKLAQTSGGAAVNITATSVASDTGHFITGARAFSVGDVIKLVNESSQTDYHISVVAGITSNTLLTVGTPLNVLQGKLKVEKVSKPKTAFKYYKDAIASGQVRYFDSTQSLRTGFKIYAIKVVLLSEDSHVTPILKNVRAIALST